MGAENHRPGTFGNEIREERGADKQVAARAFGTLIEE